MGVKAIRVEDIDEKDGPPGAFEFFDSKERKDAGIIFICPCGCVAHGALEFRPAPSPSLEWNGDRSAPTLAPSIHDQITLHDGTKKTHWHGWLRAGVWESC